MPLLFNFREEAARMWEKREADWEKERRARERLMKEVFRISLPGCEENVTVSNEVWHKPG